MGIKTYQEKNTIAMEKELAQSNIPVKKIQKPSENTTFLKYVSKQGVHCSTPCLDTFLKSYNTMYI